MALSTAFSDRLSRVNVFSCDIILDLIISVAFNEFWYSEEHVSVKMGDSHSTKSHWEREKSPFVSGQHMTFRYCWDERVVYDVIDRS